ncbi:MAG: hypothetical protein P4M11_04190 [Candidatus Pacebacteria bacterium]|nr:hypothetical protein [Candidatus Paceibacterota bacterium]
MHKKRIEQEVQDLSDSFESVSSDEDGFLFTAAQRAMMASTHDHGETGPAVPSPTTPAKASEVVINLVSPTSTAASPLPSNSLSPSKSAHSPSKPALSPSKSAHSPSKPAPGSSPRRLNFHAMPTHADSGDEVPAVTTRNQQALAEAAAQLPEVQPVLSPLPPMSSPVKIDTPPPPPPFTKLMNPGEVSKITVQDGGKGQEGSGGGSGGPPGGDSGGPPDGEEKKQQNEDGTEQKSGVELLPPFDVAAEHNRYDMTSIDAAMVSQMRTQMLHTAVMLNHPSAFNASHPGRVCFDQFGREIPVFANKPSMVHAVNLSIDEEGKAVESLVPMYRIGTPPDFNCVPNSLMAARVLPQAFLESFNFETGILDANDSLSGRGRFTIRSAFTSSKLSGDQHEALLQVLALTDSDPIIQQAKIQEWIETFTETNGQQVITFDFVAAFAIATNSKVQVMRYACPVPDHEKTVLQPSGGSLIDCDSKGGLLTSHRLQTFDENGHCLDGVMTSDADNHGRRLFILETSRMQSDPTTSQYPPKDIRHCEALIPAPSYIAETFNSPFNMCEPSELTPLYYYQRCRFFSCPFLQSRHYGNGSVPDPFTHVRIGSVVRFEKAVGRFVVLLCYVKLSLQTTQMMLEKAAQANKEHHDNLREFLTDSKIEEPRAFIPLMACLRLNSAVTLDHAAIVEEVKKASILSTDQLINAPLPTPPLIELLPFADVAEVFKVDYKPQEKPFTAQYYEYMNPKNAAVIGPVLVETHQRPTVEIPDSLFNAVSVLIRRSGIDSDLKIPSSASSVATLEGAPTEPAPLKTPLDHYREFIEEITTDHHLQDFDMHLKIVDLLRKTIREQTDLSPIISPLIEDLRPLAPKKSKKPVKKPQTQTQNEESAALEAEEDEEYRAEEKTATRGSHRSKKKKVDNSLEDPWQMLDALEEPDVLMQYDPPDFEALSDHTDRLEAVRYAIDDYCAQFAGIEVNEDSAAYDVWRAALSGYTVKHGQWNLLKKEVDKLPKDPKKKSNISSFWAAASDLMLRHDPQLFLLGHVCDSKSGLFRILNTPKWREKVFFKHMPAPTMQLIPEGVHFKPLKAGKHESDEGEEETAETAETAAAAAASAKKPRGGKARSTTPPVKEKKPVPPLKTTTPPPPPPPPAPSDEETVETPSKKKRTSTKRTTAKPKSPSPEEEEEEEEGEEEREAEKEEKRSLLAITPPKQTAKKTERKEEGEKQQTTPAKRKEVGEGGETGAPLKRVKKTQAAAGVKASEGGGAQAMEIDADDGATKTEEEKTSTETKKTERKRRAASPSQEDEQNAKKLKGITDAMDEMKKMMVAQATTMKAQSETIEQMRTREKAMEKFFTERDHDMHKVVQRFDDSHLKSMQTVTDLVKQIDGKIAASPSKAAAPSPPSAAHPPGPASAAARPPIAAPTAVAASSNEHLLASSFGAAAAPSSMLGMFGHPVELMLNHHRYLALRQMELSSAAMLANARQQEVAMAAMSLPSFNFSLPSNRF